MSNATHCQARHGASCSFSIAASVVLIVTAGCSGTGPAEPEPIRTLSMAASDSDGGGKGLSMHHSRVGEFELVPTAVHEAARHGGFTGSASWLRARAKAAGALVD